MANFYHKSTPMIKRILTLSILFLLFCKPVLGSEITLTQNRINQYVDKAENLFKDFFSDWNFLLVENHPMISYAHKSEKIREMLGYFENHRKVIVNDMESFNLFLDSYTIEDYLNKIAVAIDYNPDFIYTTDHVITQKTKMYKDPRSEKYYFYIFYDRVIAREHTEMDEDRTTDWKKMIVEVFTIDGIDFYIEKFGPDNGRFDPVKNGLVLIEPDVLVGGNLVCKAEPEELKAVENLKMEMTNEAFQRYQQMITAVDRDKGEYAEANYLLHQEFAQNLYKVINEKLPKLKGRSSAIDATISAYIDVSGKMTEFKETVISYDRIENYFSLRENIILPYLKKHKFKVNTKEYDNSKAYSNFYSEYREAVEKATCPEMFNEVLSIAETRFKTIDRLSLPQKTIYKIPIKYSFSNETSTWVSRKKKLTVKETGEEITDTALINSFKSQIRKLKNARYIVTISHHTLLDKPETIEVKEVKKGYVFYTHIGGSASMPIPVNNDFIKFKMAEYFTYNAFLIYHRIGLWGGSVFKNKNVSSDPKTDGRYIDDLKLYFEGGLYVGTAQYFYLKAGYSHLNASFSEYEHSVEVAQTPHKAYHGFLAGFSFIFPYVHFEGGYNYSFRAPYASVGVNVPINR